MLLISSMNKIKHKTQDKFSMNNHCLTGKCYCGNIKYTIKGKFRSQCFCHCRSCQLASGAPYVAWGTIDTNLFDVTRGSLKEISTPAGVTRGFCGQCGTSLSYLHENRPGELDICLATIDDPGMLQPDYHLWVADKLPWISIDDGLPQYQEWRSG